VATYSLFKMLVTSLEQEALVARAAVHIKADSTAVLAAPHFMLKALALHFFNFKIPV